MMQRKGYFSCPTIMIYISIDLRIRQKMLNNNELRRSKNGICSEDKQYDVSLFCRPIRRHEFSICKNEDCL